jgi:hypothetical protein
MIAWGPWVYDLVEMIDGDGTLRHLPEAGAYRDQPARDLKIYTIIRHQLVKRRNAKVGA